MGGERILTINGGSSSVKFALFRGGDPPRRLLSGQVERVGVAETTLRARGDDGRLLCEEAICAEDVRQAGGRLLDWLDRRGELAALGGVGHRVVEGGPRHVQPERITAALLADLSALSPLDPDHLPGEIALCTAFVERLSDVAQVACFDTAFHQHMPRVARLLPLPRRYEAAGVRRYGFHGLSYTYLVRELARVAGPEAARGRLVLAHLGAGASMAAVTGGRSVDTTMGFTPTGGLVMGTRTGDLDPGVLVYLLRSENMTAREVDELVNRRSGLLGVSGASPDMKDLIAREADDARAADAVELFCYQAAKQAAAMAVAAGGLDTLVFAGGIGERSPEVRARIAARLDFLGVELDADRNAASAAVISTAGSPACVRVIRTDEETIIALQTLALLRAAPPERAPS